MNNMLQGYIRMIKEGFKRTVTFVTMQIHPDASVRDADIIATARVPPNKPPLI